MSAAAVRRRLAVVAALTCFLGEAHAQTFVAPMCGAYLSGANLRYDTAEHARWYKRFWTGECDHLLACLPGAPNWNDITARLVARVGAFEVRALEPKICTLGQRIGLEWSREHAVRRISSDDLRRYHVILLRYDDPRIGLEIVEKAVDADLAHAKAR